MGLLTDCKRQDTDSRQRFVEDDKWRKEFNGGVDNLVRTFDYKEREQVFKYYPQYYHKTDRVRSLLH